MTRFMRVKREFKRTLHKIIIITAIIFLGLLLLFKNRSPPQPPNISCHYDFKSDYYAPVLKENETLPMRSIFFIEPTCDTTLSSRQFCAIESAATANPLWQINVLSSGISFSTIQNLTQLVKLKNIKFWRIDIQELATKTPLEEIIIGGHFKKCLYRVFERTLDVLKFLILAKWGGVYMDLDMIVVRPFGSLARNWATRQNDDEIAEGIFKFSQDTFGRFAAEFSLRHIQYFFNKNSDSCNNPRILSRVLQRMCATRDINAMSSTICNGFEVYGSQFFYPIAKQYSRDLFEPGEVRYYSAYTYYLWGQDTKDYKVMKGSPYAKLAKIHCPKTYMQYGNSFGF